MGAALLELEILNSWAQDAGRRLKFLLFPLEGARGGARPPGRELGAQGQRDGEGPCRRAGPATLGGRGTLASGDTVVPARAEGTALPSRCPEKRVPTAEGSSRTPHLSTVHRRLRTKSSPAAAPLRPTVCRRAVRVTSGHARPPSAWMEMGASVHILLGSQTDPPNPPRGGQTGQRPSPRVPIHCPETTGTGLDPPPLSFLAGRSLTRPGDCS